MSRKQKIHVKADLQLTWVSDFVCQSIVPSPDARCETRQLRGNGAEKQNQQTSIEHPTALES